jgi:hypothetical protein
MSIALPLLALLAAASADAAAAGDLTTLAEQTGHDQTGRYAEVERLCPALAARAPGRLRCFEWGKSPEGRPLLALAASSDGLLDAQATRRARRPVLLVLGGIHAGEIEGKDAGLAWLRDLTSGDPGQGARARALAAVTVLFVPVFNVDGHERFTPNHRPNQRGPRATGFRTNALNLNLNRDWVKAEAPEMAAMLALVGQWDPVLMVDLHTTDGAKFEHDLAILVAPDDPRPHQLDEVAHKLSGTLMQRLARRGHLPLPFYPSFNKEEDPASGVDAPPAPPRLSHAYFGARNRLGVLVETHSWRPYAHRVRTTRAVLDELLDEARTQAAGWRATAEAADRAEAALAGKQVTLAFDVEPQPRVIDFRGYAFTREQSEASGTTYIRYHEDRPQIWKVALRDRARPTVSVRAPGAGYLVPAAHAEWVARKLRLHGIDNEVLPADPRGAAGVATGPTWAFRADQITFASKPFEGRFTAKVTGGWRQEDQQVGAGALFVPIAQPRARLLMHLLEPTGPDALCAWGFFHAVFEEKQAMEAYVTEDEARKMLAEKPALKAELAAAMQKDPGLARDPGRRLDFFRRRHPSWDQRQNLYPVLRLERRR